MVAELIKQNRSCRRFYQDQAVPLDTLKELVNLARFCASGANLQPLKYIVSNDVKTNTDIFACLAWAAYLKEWPGPPEGERPSAYIVVLNDSSISQDAGCDHGIAAQSILLRAREKDLGGCMLSTLNRKRLSDILNIPAQFKILLVIAIGKPKEKVVLEPVGPDGNIRYWRDSEDVHHVPKRTLNEIIIAEY